MPDTTITVSGLREALAMLDDIKPATLIPVIGVAVAAEAQNRLAVYPPASRKGQPFKTEKSRRFFFAALRSGAIEVPYRRGGRNSQTLGRKWVIQPDGDGATLTNTAGYSDLVQGGQAQAAYHRGNWTTDTIVAEKMDADGSAQSIAEDAVQGAIRKAGLG